MSTGSIMIPEELFVGVLVASMPFLFGSLILLLALLGRNRERKFRSYQKFDLELVDKEETSHNDSHGVLLYRITKYKARYWNNGEKYIEFEVNDQMEEPRTYEVGDHFFGYVSPDGTKVADENSPDIVGRSRAFLYVVAAVLYAVSIAIVIGFSVPSVGSYIDAHLPHIIFVFVQVIGLILVIVGIKIFIGMALFAIRKRNHYYREIPAVVEELRTQYDQSHSASRNSYKPTYYPVFSYEIDGVRKTLESSFGEQSPRYEAGEKVTLYQNPANGKIIEDKKSGKTLAFLLIVSGSLIFLVFFGVLQLILG